MLLASCSLLFLCFLAHAGHTADQPPCTHYGSPTGAGSSCTQSAPCQVGSWWPLAPPGGVLCLLDGRYTGSAQMIAPTKAGTAAARLTVRAVSDGKALIDGQEERRPIDLRSQVGAHYVSVQGVNLVGGSDSIIMLGGTHNAVQRVVAYGRGTIEISGEGNLLEDAALFGGPVRKPLNIGAGGGTGNTVRRVWVRWEWSDATSSPHGVYDIGYDQHESLLENILSTYGRRNPGESHDYNAGIAMFSTRGSRVLGSIAYQTEGSDMPASTAISVWGTGGSHPGQTYTNGARLVDIVSYIAPGHPQFAHKIAFTAGDTRPGGDNIATNVVAVSGGANTCHASAWQCNAMKFGTSLSAAIGEGNSVWQVVPGICKRVVNGILSEQGLWPWPMNQRILDATTAAGLTPVDLTATMVQLFGSIPAACLSGSEPPPPSGDTQAPQVTLAAPSDGALVSGTALALVATATDNTAVAGVGFQVDGVSTGPEPCCNQPGPSVQASLALDTTTLANGPHTLQATARDPAGNVATSAPVRLLVFNGQRPPAPEPGPHPALSCVGTVQAVPGAVEMICTPQPAR